MNKSIRKFISIILCFILVFTLSSCTKVPEKTEVEDSVPDIDAFIEEEESIPGVPNPMTELTKGDFDKIYGASWVPEGSEDVHYFTIQGFGKDESDIVEIDFTRFEHEYCFRYLKGPEQDISGMYFTWNYDKEDDKLSDTSPATCHIQINDTEGAGLASWYDENSGTNYSISMSEGATRDLLLSTFESYYGFYCATYGIEN